MRLIRSIAMFTDHDYHGRPVETGRVDLFCSEVMTEAQIALTKEMQEIKLHSMAKRMPHDYWRKQKK